MSTVRIAYTAADSALDGGTLTSGYIEAPAWCAGDPESVAALYLFGYASARYFIIEASVEDVDDEQPDREPTPDQERAWDLREDDARGHALTSL
jgi:hypothetical protein